MRYPFVLSSHCRIVIASNDWLSKIGKLNADRHEIEVGINRLGENSLSWFLDADGLFFALAWRGIIPRSLAQLIGLTRQRERYSIAAPRKITAAEVLALIADYREQFEEAPNTGDLRSALLALHPNANLDAAFMREYLGLGLQHAA